MTPPRRTATGLARRAVAKVTDAVPRQASRADFDVIVVSYGGSGSTMLARFLADHLQVNHWNSLEDGIKHIDSPNHPVLRSCAVDRAIWVYSDPREAVVSLFRRGYHRHMVAKLRAQHRTAHEFRRYVAKNRTGETTLTEFLRDGDDLFRFEEHWRNWAQRDPVPFPILCVGYESMYENLDEVLGFVGLAPTLRGSFPEQRSRALMLDTLEPSDRALLDTMYGALADEMAATPDVCERAPTS